MSHRSNTPRRQAPSSASVLNNPSSGLSEKQGFGRKSPPPQSYNVQAPPNVALAKTNRLIVHPLDFNEGQHVLVNNRYALTVLHDNTNGSTTLARGTIGVAAMQRQWIGLKTPTPGDQVNATVSPLPSPPHPGAPSFIVTLDIEIDIWDGEPKTKEVFKSDDLARSFVEVFSGVILSANQVIGFRSSDGHDLRAIIKSFTVLDPLDEHRSGASGGQQPPTHDMRGILFETTNFTFTRASGSAIEIKPSAKAPTNAVVMPNFKFEDLGIGGLDKEINEIFRRAFASRTFPLQLVRKLGIRHVKGIIFHGPPGTGKTLIARQIGKMLTTREPKVVNGPEILNKFVGTSEENIRNLFKDAEAESKKEGDESDLHVIIFDEFDAVFKQRGSTNNGSGVGDSIVNQLLSKMDGIEQLNNILIIAMTNRLDMIDDALLRPGRFEVHMEISLPNQGGRFQILNIHTSTMRRNNVMDKDVDLEELAKNTKNFSGAEIEGLVKSATSFAFKRHEKEGTTARFADNLENFRVNKEDFDNALQEVHPAFGVLEGELQQVMDNGIIRYDTIVEDLLESGRLFVEQVRTSTRTPLVSVLLHGPAGSGKTALGAYIAKASDFPFIRLVSPENMVGHSEAQKVTAITKVFADSYKSPLSIVVVDDIERLIDWAPTGERFSNAVLQTLLVLFKKQPPKGKRLLIIATSSLHSVLKNLGLSKTFNAELRVPPIWSLHAMDQILEKLEVFPSAQDRKRAIRLLKDVGLGGQDELNASLQIGIKEFISTVEIARQKPDKVAERLRDALKSLKK